jgi:hypothetical protein
MRQLLTLLAILLFTGANCLMAQTTYYVAPPTTGDDSNSGLFGLPKATIQAAINAASGGDIIDIATGTYNERVTVDKSLTLNGAGQTNTILDGSTGLTGNGKGITISSGITNVTIRNLTVRKYSGASGNLDAGIYGVGGNDGLLIENVTLEENTGGSGFYANGPVNGVHLKNLKVFGHPNVGGVARGIVIWNGFKQNITIEDCEVYNNNCCGIELQDGTASGVTIVNNNVYNNGDNGIGVVGLMGPGENLIAGNTLVDNGRFGIEIKNPNGSGLTTGAGSILVENNTVSRTPVPSDARDLVGIAAFRRGVLTGNVDVPTGVVIRNNTVAGYRQTSTSDGFGIVIEGTNHTVSGNTVNDCDVGIQQQAGHTPYPGDGDQTNLDDDYFGRGNSPITCGNSVTANTFGSGANANGVDTRNVGGPFKDTWVANSTAGTTFCSIQAAITAAAAGDEILASAGTYQESLGGWRDFEIFKSLTLKGAGSGVTIVELSGKDNGVEVRPDATGIFALEGMTFTKMTSNTRSAGFALRFGETGGTFTSITLRDVDVAHASARNIFYDNVNATYTSILIEDCDIHSSGAWGMSMRGTLGTVDIKNTSFDNNGLTIPANGIGLDLDMPVIVNSLNVTGGSFNNNKSKGINLTKTSNATFTDIVATGNGGAPAGGFGVSLWEWSDASSNLTFINANLSNNTTDGFLIGSETGKSVTNVTITGGILSGNTRGGLFIYRASGCCEGVIQNISITDAVINNNGQGVAVIMPYENVSAIGNWWGSESGPSHASNPGGTGNIVTASVEYSPWLAELPGTAPMTWWTNNSIQAATDVIDGGDILGVKPGTYSGNLNIGKPMTLMSGLASGSLATAPTVEGLITVASDDVTVEGIKITNPGGSYAISSNGNSNITVRNNFVTDIGTSKLSGPTHAVAFTSASTTDIDNIVVKDNIFTTIRGGENPALTGVTAKGNNGSGSAITVGFSDANFEVSGLLIEGNQISDVKSCTKIFDEGGKGAYGILINVGGRATPNPGANVKDPVIRNNTITALEGLWAHGIGLEGITPGALVYGNDISYLTDYKTPPDAVAVMVEHNPQAGSVTLFNNIFAPGVAVGVNRVASSSGTVDARHNWWGSSTGPMHLTNPAGTGAIVSDNVLFEPWTWQANVTETGTQYTFDDIHMQFSALPPGGGFVTVNRYSSPPPGYPTLPIGSISGIFLDIVTSMPNYSFSVTVTVADLPSGFDVNTVVMYFNTASQQWIPLEGVYDAIAGTFTFSTNHFTAFAFADGNAAAEDYRNTAGTAYDLFVTGDPMVTGDNVIYPNNTWDLPTPLPAGYPSPAPDNDWGYTGSQAVSVYIVPEVDAEFGASYIDVQWTDDVLGSVSASYNGSIYGPSLFATWETLAWTDRIRLDASLGNENFDDDLQTGDYIAKLDFELKRPGSSQIDIIGADLRWFGTNKQYYVWSQPTNATIKAYLGDVARPGTSSPDETSGDGKIDLHDLTVWSLAYWSGVPGYVNGMTNYKVKFDIGPTSTNYVDGLPEVDGKIEFEDLMIFAINYGRSASDNLLRNVPTPDVLRLAMTDATQSYGVSEVTLSLTDLPVDLRGLSLQLAGDFGTLLSVEYEGPTENVTVFHLQQSDRILVDLAALGGERGIAEAGKLLTLRFSGSAAIERITGLARDSRNREMQLQSLYAPVAGDITLSANYPNPFNPVTNISFTVPESMPVRLEVYDQLGRKVAVICDGMVSAGLHTLQWNGRDLHGQLMPSGMYVYRLSAGETVLHRSMILGK